jgi:hypothetical protein
LLAELLLAMVAYAFWPRAARAALLQIAMFAWIVLPGVLGSVSAIVAAVTRARTARVLAVVAVWVLGGAAMIALTSTRLGG